MSILVTGGAGFIGSHLVEELLAQGEDVIVIDDLSTGSIQNLANTQSALTLISGSLLDLNLAEALQGKKIEKIIHLAAIVGVAKVMANPARTFELNSRAAERALNFAAKCESAIFLASSSEVYGNSAAATLHEKMSLHTETDSPRWLYAKAKIEDERAAAHMGRELGLKSVIGRFFNTVGPRQIGTYGMVLPRFVKAALSHQPLTVYGDGSQVRTFLHVRDCIRAINELVAIASPAADPFNIGGTEPISILELAQLVISELGSKSDIRFQRQSEVFGEDFEEIRQRVPEVTKITNSTNWAPRYSLREIIHDTAEYEVLPLA